MEGCVFCKIVLGEIPSYKVWEDQNHLSFLDINPIKEGHTLVIPKAHHAYLFDIEGRELSNLMRATKKVADILKKAFSPKSGKIGAIVYGLDVDHAHIHLIPIDQAGDLSFTNKKTVSSKKLRKTLDKINQVL